MRRKVTRKTSSRAKPTLLSGGNPKITKADGDAPVQAYIAAMPGWKREVGECIDAIIVGAFPSVRKAVKWNSPFYGVEGEGWIVALHCFAKYIKVSFFNGSSLAPLPPIESKMQHVRYLHIFEGELIDEAQFARWIRQARRTPGWGKC